MKLTEYRKEHCELCRDYKSSFKELLQKDKSITTHQKNLQHLAIEIYKVRMGISQKTMNEIFLFSKNSVYRLRSGIQLEKPSINTAKFGSESTVYLGAKIWELIPENIKSSKSVDVFKSKIKKWVPEICPCRPCKTYVSHVGFVN